MKQLWALLVTPGMDFSDDPAMAAIMVMAVIDRTVAPAGRRKGGLEKTTWRLERTVTGW